MDMYDPISLAITEFCTPSCRILVSIVILIMRSMH